MSTIKESVKNATISVTSVLLGTAYVGLRLTAEGAKKLEASIITSIDDNYTKAEVFRARMESYNEFKNQLSKIDETFKSKVQELNKKFRKNSVRNEIRLTDQEHIGYAH